jgi:Fur family peroxide stress response transcriptional regulator
MLTEGQLADRISEFERACHQAGIKLTHQRIEVLREVARSEAHPTADSILAGVKARIPTVSVDTVYRTLWLLTDLGLITTLGPRRDAVRFDANLSPHHHYICVKCGVTVDIEPFDMEAARLGEKLKAVGTVDSTHLEIHGVCAECTSKVGQGSP